MRANLLAILLVFPLTSTSQTEPPQPICVNEFKRIQNGMGMLNDCTRILVKNVERSFQVIKRIKSVEGKDLKSIKQEMLDSAVTSLNFSQCVMKFSENFILDQRLLEVCLMTDEYGRGMRVQK